jgi:hypothetical protein
LHPCNIGIYSPAEGKNELEEKTTLQGVSHKKKIIGGKAKHAYIAGR